MVLLFSSESCLTNASFWDINEMLFLLTSYILDLSLLFSEKCPEWNGIAYAFQFCLVLDSSTVARSLLCIFLS